MQQELLNQTELTATNNSTGNRSLRRFVTSFICTGLILLGVPAIAQPTVTALSTLVGYQGAAITITGTGFSATPASNIVYFGATKATVSAASATSLSVTVPRGTTYMPVSVLNTATGTGLQGWSPQAFLQGFSSAGFASGTINLDPHFDFSTGANPAGIAFADMDGDGKPDMVVANGFTKTISIFKNNTTIPGPISAATFLAPVTFSTGAIPVYKIAIGDLDGDGQLDVAAGASSGNQIIVLRNNTIAAGTLSLVALAPMTAANNPYSVAIGDADGDGKPDLVCANDGGNNFTAYRSTSTPGTISFTAGTNFVTAAQTDDIVMRDIDGDGKRDIIVVNAAASSNNMMVFRNSAVIAAGPFAAGSFVLTSTYPFPALSAPECLLVGDVDGDGKVDVVVGNKQSPSKISVYHNTSTPGTVTLGLCTTQNGLNIESMAFGDLDGDGKPDIVATNLADTSISVFHNTSTSGVCSFASQCVFKTGSTSVSPAFVAVGDVDNDGQSDVAVSNYNGSTVSVFRNSPLLPIQPVGGLQVCASGLDSAQFTEAALGGTWTSSNTAIAIIDTFSGYVSGVSAAGGTATITYNSGCGFTTTTVTVNPTPTSLLGTHIVCIGTAYTYTATPTGGTFTVTNTSVATITSGGGVLTGLTPGFDTVSYYVGTTPKCRLVTTLNVFTPPVAITGTLNVCVGSTTQLTDASGGGVWSMCNGNATTSVAGLVTGVTAGTDCVSYTSIASSCAVGAVVTVNALPSGITGNLSVCQGLTTTLSSTTAGGTWSSGNPAVATVILGPGGTTTVTAVSSGTSTITYTSAAGCITTAVVTVNSLPGAINGTLSVCVGLTTQLTDATGGGTWSASNGNATISGTGLVTGVNGGASFLTDVITYTGANTCSITATVTVNAIPAAISGTLSVCVGLTTQLTDATGGGTWSASNGNATVSGTGLVTGVNGGASFLTDNITYTSPAGCITTSVVTVNALPPAITGTLSVCVGLTTALTDGSAGGTWSSSNTGVATVSASGLVTGVSGFGTATIIHTTPAGCVNTASTVVTVNPLPTAILGTLTVCPGTTTQLSDATGGGSWSLSNGNATINATGLVTGATAGTDVVTYTLITGCIKTAVVTINPLPTSITGTTSVCVGFTTQLTDGTAGGTWASSLTGVATVSASGLVTGISGVTAGSTSTITYTTGSGCYVTTTVTVYPVPTAILGNFGVCIGLTTQLSDATGLGTWSTSNGNISISGTGLVTGLTCPTTSTVSYTLGSGCYVTQPVTVNCNPTAPTGPSLSVCVGLTTTLTATPAGGTWSSSASGIAGVTATGVVIGNFGYGTATITYTLPTGCINTSVVTVNPLPTSINGTLSVCVGLTTQLTDGTVGGTWSSSSPGIAGITSGGGLVTGGSAGTSTITYLLNTGCLTTAVVTVNANPGPINGTLSVCQGLTTSLSDGTAGGTWSASNGNVTISGGGLVTGVTCPATSVITYTMPTTCINTAVVTVNCNPAPINGTLTVCIGLTTQLTDATLGGAWSSGSGNVTVSATGLVTGISAGTANITYTMPTGCIGPVVTVTVNALPTSINGTLVVCQGLTTQLTDGTAGGTWSSGSVGVATVSATGLVYGVITGSGVQATSTITYTLGTGCIATAVVSVNPLPTSINGTLSVCIGLTTQLTDGTAGGAWSSTFPSIGSISATGLVTGIAAGTTTITYSIGATGCITTAVVTVNPNPNPISGTLSVCQGYTTSLSDVTGGGGWSASNGNITISGVGLVTGITCPATSVVTYTLPTTCIATAVVTVNCNPGPITGTATVCVGLTTSLTDASPGGTWTSSNFAIASVSGTGVVTGNTAGTATITHTIASGCYSTVVVTVNPNPTAILGTLSVCLNLTTQLSDATGGGTWSSSAPGNASVSGTGLVTGLIAPSTAIITYALGTGCIATAVVTVNPLPGPILGNLNVCQGLSTLLSDASPFGTWTSSTTSIATVTVGGGNVTGVLTGSTVSATSTITYTLPTTCIITAVVTVNPLPAAITGTLTVCVGLTTQLSDVTPLGTWSSGNTSVATVITGSGLVTGIAGLSTAVITYTLPTSCYSTAIVTVDPLPTIINGNLTVCQGLTTLLTDATGGGTWTSSNPGNASVGLASGVVTGNIGGTTATITYTLPTGCIITAVVTVNPLPGPINGVLDICSGLTSQLTDASGGGTWSSGNPSVASIDVLTGLATAVASVGFAVTTTITYTLPSTCIITAVVTVEPLPNPITGTLTVCSGATTALTDATVGGNWSSSNPPVASVSGTGVVTGGFVIPPYSTATITYMLPTGCIATAIVTVDPLPTAILGTLTVCQGYTTQLSDATIGGTWASGSTGNVTINVSTGLATGVTASTTSTITYTLPTGCTTTAVVTVNPNPTPILPPAPHVCVGSTIILSDATLGGIWSGSDATKATVGSGTGAVTGVGAGLFVDTYTLSTGCYVTTLVTVNPLPTAILGTLTVCEGSTTQLSDVTPGGTWSSLTVTNATISSTGLVTGVVGGLLGTTSTISYTLTSTGCAATAIVTVEPIPAVINGSLTVCVGLITSLTDAVAGGVWISGNTGVATISSPAVGDVTGISSGTSVITYEFASTGCMVNAIVTVNPIPGSINGTLTVCNGLTTALTDGTAGGTWSSSNPSTATISSTGVVTGGLSGTSVITYMLPTGCLATAVVTVNPNPAAIVGATGVCVGASTALTDITPGGNWNTSNPGIATVSGSGVVTGVSVGSAIVTYALPTGCLTLVTVNVSTAPPPITGTTSICIGSTVLLTDLVSGTWSSSNPAVASVDAFGATTGNSVGTATITIFPPTGCIGTIVVTVYPTPAVPTGSPLFVCVGLTTTLNDATAGGTWSSSDATIASIVDVTGVVTGVSGGTAVITYTMPTYCYSTVVVTVNNNPGAINGNPNLCLGGTTILASGPPGGTWMASAGTGSVTFTTSISSPAVTVFGAAIGTATVTYVLPTGCLATLVVTVHPNPLPVTGIQTVCVGGTTAFTDATAGGTWSSGNTSVATVDPTGLVTGVSAGTASIIYTGAGGCASNLTVTVNPIPPAILGTTTVCKGFTTQLSDTSPGGTWSSSNTSNATVSGTGLVTGISGSTSATITYTSAAGCTTTVMVSVNDTPGPIIGTLTVCVGSTTVLTDGSFGGTWVSGSPAIDTVGFFTGISGGVSAGTSVITYAFSTGCYTTSIMTVNPLPAAITGALGVCVGATTQLSDATGGGTWSSSNADATISGTGLVTGVTVGTSTISYTAGTGCAATAIVTVYPIPAPITGTLTVCVGLTTTLSDATTGGTWASSNTGVATIGVGSGVATGITAGTTTDTYTIAHGCHVTAVLTVDPLPAAISGSLGVCLGLTTTLTDATGGGTWTSSNSAIAPIGSSTGIVSGVAVGTAIVTYTLPTGCIKTAVMTVNPLPLGINGVKTLCAGNTTALTDTTTGGTWSSSTLGVATVDIVTGVVTGVSGGTTTITYTLSTGCIKTTVVTVNPVPANISGTLVVCVGSTTNLTDATGGGFWYSSIPPLATIGSTSGVVTGVSAGTVVITYILPSPSGCQTTAVVTINPIPQPIDGSSEICVGNNTLLTDSSAGGVWSASFVLISGGSATGLVNGSAVGTGTSTYTFPATGCMVTHVVTVDPLPSAIAGTLEVCVGLTTTLTDATLGGTWSSASASIATITTGGGVATGVSAGTTTITYTSAQGCNITAVLTVNPLPSAILGASAVCYGGTLSLSDLTGGGGWTSSDPTTASVSASGVVTGNNLGTATITYTIPTGCYVTHIVTVNKVPANILGNLTVCVGLTTALSDTSAGGIWSSSAGAIGTVGSTTGVVMGVSAGTTIITYAVATSCLTTAVVTVNPLPTAILGSRDVCIGLTSSLTDLSGGGVWTSSNPVVATIGSASGVVTGNAIGTSTITYTLPTGCLLTTVVTVHPVPAAISGTNKICIGSSISLSDATPGGTWSSSDPAVAPVTSSGIVTGLTLGTATITYSPAVGCVATVIVTVNPLPNIYTIFGGGSYCQGGSGVPIGLNGSDVGVSYLLFYDSSATGFLAGTGDSLHFGLLTVPGTYTVLATGTTSGCTMGMSGTVSVIVIPTVNPTVTIHAYPGDTVCPGTSVTFSVTSTPVGTTTMTPTFMWSVNGVNVSTGSTYTFTPANNDVVKVVMNSGAICIFPTVATDTLRMKVLQIGTPLVSVTVDPGDTVCQYATATFTATPTFGGTTPLYYWIVNNALAGTGHIFTYAPNNGDVVYVKMFSSYQCTTSDTAYSTLVHMTILPMIIPHIDIVPHPGFSVLQGNYDTLTTVVSNAGPDPTYQWEINGVPVPGATASTYISNSFHNYDSVTCLLTSSGFCDGITTFDWVYITVIPLGVGNVQYVGVSDIMLIPNPTSGAITVRGTLSTTTDEDLSLEITDMLGQIVYKNKVRSDKGKINQQILLGDNLANGMYILNLSTGSDNKAFHFVLER